MEEAALSTSSARALSKTESDRSVGLESAPPLASTGNSWDWPLSRNEKQERVRLIDEHVSSLDRNALLGEIEHLRTSCGRSATSSFSVDAR